MGSEESFQGGYSRRLESILHDPGETDADGVVVQRLPVDAVQEPRKERRPHEVQRRHRVRDVGGSPLPWLLLMRRAWPRLLLLLGTVVEDGLLDDGVGGVLYDVVVAAVSAVLSCCRWRGRRVEEGVQVGD